MNTKDTSVFDQKWKLWRGTFVQIPTLLIHNKKRLGLSDVEFYIVILLLSYWWEKDKWPFPSQRDLLESCGKNLRSVERVLSNLAKHSGPQSNGWSLEPGYIRRVKKDDVIPVLDENQRSNRELQKDTAYDLGPLLDVLQKLSKKNNDDTPEVVAERMPVAKTQERVFVFSQKWGLTNQTFVQVPTLLIRYKSRLSVRNPEFTVLLALLSYWWKPGTMPRPSVQTLADISGKTKRSVQRILSTLEEEHKFIHRIGRAAEVDIGIGGPYGKKTKIQRPNVYDLSGLVRALRKLSNDLIKSELALREKNHKREPIKK